MLALALATIVAVLVARWKPADLAAAFPADLFLTLVGVSVLFGAAQANGTLGAVKGEVLDPGTGPGHHAIYYASKGYSATGIDASPTGLDASSSFSEAPSTGLGLDMPGFLATPWLM